MLYEKSILNKSTLFIIIYTFAIKVNPFVHDFSIPQSTLFNCNFLHMQYNNYYII